MNRGDFYRIYQENLMMLEQEMGIVKKYVQISLGRYEYEKDLGRNTSFYETETLAGTRLFCFLMCAWFEARLYKILYEDSSEGVSDSEIVAINAKRTIGEKWKVSYHVAICRKHGFAYQVNKDYSMGFTIEDDRNNYLLVEGLLNEIDKAIIVRNRLAHGQCKTPLTSSRTNISTEILNYLNQYDNIQKLDYQFKYYKLIAEIINDLAVSNETYKRNITSKMELIKTNREAIIKRKFEKYCKPFVKKEKQKQEMNRLFKR